MSRKDRARRRAKKASELATEERQRAREAARSPSPALSETCVPSSPSETLYEWAPESEVPEPSHPLSPLYLEEHKLAYNPLEGTFSVNGGAFDQDIIQLPQKCLPKAYKLLVDAYPRRAESLLERIEPYMHKESVRLLKGGSPTWASIAASASDRVDSERRATNEQKARLVAGPRYTLVDTDEKMRIFMLAVSKVKKFSYDLFCDCEGDSLGREGTLSTFQVEIATAEHCFVLDVSVLGAAAFNTSGPEGRNFGDILEDEDYPKIFWDCRQDSDAVYAHQGIHMRGIVDLQLLQLAVTQGDRAKRMGLASCISRYASHGMTWKERAQWSYTKTAGSFACKGPERYAIFDRRPLAPILGNYAVNDVIYMPIAFKNIWSEVSLDKELLNSVLELSQTTATASTEHDYKRPECGWLSPSAVSFWKRLPVEPSYWI